MTLNSWKNKGSRTIALLALSWLTALTLSSRVQPSLAQIQHLSSAANQPISFSQNTIEPLIESITSLVNFSFQQTTGNDFSSQTGAALLEYNRLIKCSIARQHQLLHQTVVKYRKADLLFPSHYFW